jgi:shikimate kinase
MSKNIVLIGMPGSGKTTVGSLIAKKLLMEFIDMDKSLVKRKKMTVAEMFAISEEFFRDAETEYAMELCNKDSLVISTGGGIVKRKENIDYLKQNSIIIFINRSVENIISDIDINSRPLLKENIDNIYKLYNERIELYKKYCDIEILNEGIIDETAEKIISTVITKL